MTQRVLNSAGPKRFGLLTPMHHSLQVGDGINSTASLALFLGALRSCNSSADLPLCAFLLWLMCTCVDAVGTVCEILDFKIFADGRSLVKCVGLHRFQGSST